MCGWRGPEPASTIAALMRSSCPPRVKENPLARHVRDISVDPRRKLKPVRSQATNREWKGLLWALFHFALRQELYLQNRECQKTPSYKARI